MTPSRRPQRLPSRVYWVRRGLVLGTAFVLIFAIAHLFGGSGSAAPAAKDSAVKHTLPATPTPSTGSGAPIGPTVAISGTPGATATGSTPPAVLAQPDGPCALDEITATPVVGTRNAGGSIPLTLSLTGIRPACTFAVSASSLVAKVTTGSTRIWSSQDCPASVPKQNVVVRSGTPTTVTLNWNGRTSQPGCVRATRWALPGSYQAVAAVIGSAPATGTFRLTAPPRKVITKVVHPKHKKATGTAKGTATPDAGR
ncbi:MAG: hypothetical protein JWP74_1304 [Marmoricola sp.]|nr:hypothetical protein [Marmoricola sp.]